MGDPQARFPIHWGALIHTPSPHKSCKLSRYHRSEGVDVGMLRQNGARESLAPSSPNLTKEVANGGSTSSLLHSRRTKKEHRQERERVLHSPGLKHLAQRCHTVTVPGTGDTAPVAHAAQSCRLMLQPPAVLGVPGAARRWLAVLHVSLLQPATPVRCSEVSQRLFF